MARVAIIATGFIGRAWAISYARAGHSIALWDAKPEAPAAALTYIDALLPDLAANGLIDEPPAALRARMSVAPTLAAALDGVDYVQENTPEDVAVKREIFAAHGPAGPARRHPRQLDLGDPALAVHRASGRPRAAASSCIRSTRPISIPAAEVVPAPWTDRRRWSSAPRVPARGRAMRRS